MNIVLKEYPDHYADLSYSRESFNVNKAQTVFKRNLRGSGLVFGVGGGYTYADNSYTMESPYVKGLKIRRDHDNFRKLMVGGSLKAKKWWFDEVEFEPAFVKTYKEIQGIETDIRQAHTTSRGIVMSNKLEKDDFFLPGLDFDMTTAVAYTEYSLVDTAKVWYDWTGKSYPTPSPLGGEIGNRFPSNSAEPGVPDQQEPLRQPEFRGQPGQRLSQGRNEGAGPGKEDRLRFAHAKLGRGLFL